MQERPRSHHRLLRLHLLLRPHNPIWSSDVSRSSHQNQLPTIRSSSFESRMPCPELDEAVSKRHFEMWDILGLAHRLCLLRPLPRSLHSRHSRSFPKRRLPPFPDPHNVRIHAQPLRNTHQALPEMPRLPAFRKSFRTIAITKPIFRLPE